MLVHCFSLYATNSVHTQAMLGSGGDFCRFIGMVSDKVMCVCSLVEPQDIPKFSVWNKIERIWQSVSSKSDTDIIKQTALFVKSI